MKTTLTLLVLTALAAAGQAATFAAADYGIVPGKTFKAADVTRLLGDIRKSAEPATLVFAPGVYDIGPDQCQERTWYISNHDQWNPKRVFLPLEGMEALTVKATGAFLNLRGRIIPVGIWDSAGVTIEGLTVDYETPPLAQATFTEVDANAKTRTLKVRRAEASSSRPMAGLRIARRTRASISTK